jgi:hypothetical protein
VQHALRWRVVDGVGRSDRCSRARATVERAVARDDRFERLAGTNSITMKKTFSCFLGRQDRDDVRVVERGQQPRLAQQLAEIDALFVRDLEATFLSIQVSSAR